MSDKTEEGTSSSSGNSGKVARLIEKYDLPRVGDDLEEYWTADEDRLSLRELATYFNKELLRSQLDSQGADMLPGEVDNLYRLLTDDDVTSGVRTQAQNRLRDNGIDPSQLSSDFVSRQAIHTYLKNDRGAQYNSGNSPKSGPDSQLEQIQRLKSRQSAVAEQALSSLRNRDEITLGEFQVLVSVRVQCIDCGTQYEIGKLIDEGGCECPSE